MNYFNNPSMIAAEALSILMDKMIITTLTAKDKTADFMVKPNGYAVGSKVDIKQYGDYTVDEFNGTVNVQNIRNSTRSMEIEKHFDVTVQIGAKEQALNFDGFSNEVLAPAMGRLAEKVDTYVGTKLLKGAGLYTSASLFGDVADMANARKAATIQQLEFTRLSLVDLTLEATLLGNTVFNQAQTGGSDAERRLREGLLGRLMGMDFWSSIAFPEFSRTAGDGTTTVDSSAGDTNLIGLSVLTVDATTGTFNAGDRINVAGCRRPLIVSTQTAATATEIPLTDPITEIIEDGAAVTVIGSGSTYDVRGVIMDDRSLATAFPLLDMPSDKPASVVTMNGVSIRLVKGYDMTTKKETMSLDLLCGAEAFDPRRITVLGDTQ